MSSLRQTLASRANGARSLGPATPQGKRRSSQNATTHGLLARCIVMENESTAAFEALVAHHCAESQHGGFRHIAAECALIRFRQATPRPDERLQFHVVGFVFR